MKALLLAAGEGRRLGALTAARPKALLPVLNIPLIEFSLAALAGVGAKEVLVNTHHLSECFAPWLGTYRGPPTVHLAHEPVLLGTGGALRNLASELAGGTFVIANADLLHGIDLKAALKEHQKSGALATLLLRPEGWRAAGGFWVKPGGRIGGYLAPGEDPPQEMRAGLFTGLHIVEPGALAELPEKSAFCIVRDFYRPLIARGAPLGAHFVGGASWQDLGTPGRYLEATLDLFANLGADAPLPERARKLLRLHGYQKHGPCWRRGVGTYDEIPSVLGDGITLGEGAGLTGPALVGDGARLEPGARIARCLVWPGATVPQGNWEERIFYGEGQSLPVW